MTHRSETLHATTDDGVRLELTRVVATSGATRGAVLMQHGLGSNSAAFLVPGQSLAEHLAGLGYDCYVSELRGAGKSERPTQPYGLAAYIDSDLPALLACVQRTSGRARIAYIGHSLGGVIAFMHLIDHPDTPIERLITVGTAFDYRPGKNVYRKLNAILPVAKYLPVVPFGGISRMLSPLAGIGPTFMPEGMNFHRPNMDRAITSWVMAHGFTPIPMPLLLDLSSVFSEDGLQLKEREPYLPRAAAIRAPMLMIGGTADPQCPPVATEASFALLRSVQHKRRITFGKAFGQREDYGHFDLLIGKHAREETWPSIEAFLAESLTTANVAAEACSP